MFSKSVTRWLLLFGVFVFDTEEEGEDGVAIYHLIATKCFYNGTHFSMVANWSVHGEQTTNITLKLLVMINKVQVLLEEQPRD